jgi:hypothetical protein
MCIGLKKIMKFQKGKPRWHLENLYAARQKAENFVEEKWIWEQRDNINKFVLDTVIGLVGKVERRPREQWNTYKVKNKG